MSMFRQCPERKEGAKEDHTRHGKCLSRITLAHQGMPKSPLLVFSHPKGSYESTIRGLTQPITRARKGKGPKCTIHFQCLIQSCSPYWFRIMGFLPSPQGLEDLHIQKSMMSVLSVNTMEELEGIPQKIAWPSRIKSNPWSTQIRSNSEDLSTVTRSIKIKDELGAVFVCLLLWMFSFVNAFLEKCKTLLWCRHLHEMNRLVLDILCHYKFC